MLPGNVPEILLKSRLFPGNPGKFLTEKSAKSLAGDFPGKKFKAHAQMLRKGHNGGDSP